MRKMPGAWWRRWPASSSRLARSTDLPGTLNCRIAQQAYARLQELAHPGREAPVLLQFVTDRLAEIQPEKSRVIAACRLSEQSGGKRIPPPPRIFWEGEGEG